MLTRLSQVEPFPLAVVSQEIDRLFRGAFDPGAGAAARDAAGFVPAVDVDESDDAFLVHLELPGVPASEVGVSLEGEVLTVSGERRFYSERDRAGFSRLERRFGRFSRSVRLPERVDADRVSASARDGVVTVVVPKAEDARPRRIEVAAG